jgi:fatty acid desaturase
MAIVKNFPQMSRAQKTFLDFFWIRWVPILALAQYSLFWLLASRQQILKTNLIKSVASLTFPALALTAMVWFSLNSMAGFTAFALGYVGYFVAVEVVNFPHHLELPHIKGEHHYPLWEQWKISRTCLYPSWLSRSVTLNFNYHVEHHLFPDLPWYRLDQAHVLVKDAVGVEYNGDENLDWISRNRPKSLVEVLKSTRSDQIHQTDSTAA